MYLSNHNIFHKLTNAFWATGTGQALMPVFCRDDVELAETRNGKGRLQSKAICRDVDRGMKLRN